MLSVKRNDIGRFSNRLHRIINNSILEKLLIAICEKGTEYAKSSYGDTSIVVDYTINSSNGVGIITANGNHVAYIEFGTGELGRGAYSGELPDEEISFYSNAYEVDVTVAGWTYSYAKKLELTDKPWNGRTPRADMWKTAQYMRTVFITLMKEWYENEIIS